MSLRKPKLKPCPFCGGKTVLQVWKDPEDNKSKLAQVWCRATLNDGLLCPTFDYGSFGPGISIREIYGFVSDHFNQKRNAKG